MARTKPNRNKKFFTVDQANRTLPLVRVIVKDISELAQNLMQRQERLAQIESRAHSVPGDPYYEEYEQMKNQLAKDAARLEEYADELLQLGVQLKGYDGIVDFPAWMDGREVCLCWKIGEPEVAHWHEVDTGFAGRQKLVQEAVG